MDKHSLIEKLKAQGITSDAVLAAMEKVPREAFVQPVFLEEAYGNYPLPIGHEQTISQPYIVARMTELLLTPLTHNVLEIGTGSGYQAAVLSELVAEVYTIERIEPLLIEAKDRFKKLKYTNIHTLFGDGHLGWPEKSPFDAIMVTAATKETPPALLDQLAENGRLLLPLGIPGHSQQLQLIIRKGKTFDYETYDPVTFVPLLTGRTTE
ncbi:MAG TPA: protein-L-isoaspartate(D-aspartate) O-methyltransferase [Gammaproteobacteria bacterium]|nr:protein-L-isoaspartate(D-aspartate) O-methyltransferase [Gammaproteobacteria bacterium]